ncbi:glycosyltransferase family 2 protein [Sneathiella limimaris]|uniref:glycosyltransferase family 2 protein n=1 Tax=Sneathiella limimaris TaxID=1964213 RepID=UPI0019D10117|nr:glycosyltransferase family 2 protein [Sneathiella limimaris]
MITIVVPVFNEGDNIEPLIQEIFEKTEDLPISEVIYVDDASTDRTWDLLLQLRHQFSYLRIVRHQKNSGQSSALWTGINAAGNEIIVTLDGDGQNPPDDIKRLWRAFEENKRNSGSVAILGERHKRNDNWIRRLSSRFANFVRASCLRDGTRDTGCSLKLFRRIDYLNLPYFDHMHRFLPALFQRDGVTLIHVGVSHRHRLHGQSKYGTLDRALVGISDLLGVMWLRKRSRKVLKSNVYEELN